ncbi:MAG: type I glyceraldehyde-3-phosphate dehydrogenase [Bacteroidetes bacterium]|nr:type I glyceraldehyde-3-phosphate dehydrogenase [Bacteroidota bacterium]
MKIAINGFGRIGRLAFKFLFKNKNIEIVAINDLADTKTLAHLLKYDSIHGKFQGEINYDENHLIINGKKILITAEKDPSILPWGKLEIDIVLESTGLFTDKEKALNHIKAGAKKVVISAPAKGDVKTIVIGVNDDTIDGSEQILSNASCTTNCLAPMVKILDDNFGIINGFITTVHSYTSDQNLHDAPHRDLRRARAAACSIIPTTTGAAKTVSTVLPHLKGKLNGNSMRVPVSSGSITDFTCILKKNTTPEQVNALFKEASENKFKNIIEYCTEPIVSADIVGNTYSCIFDSELTMVIDNTVKIVGWYDNEAGYSARLADLIEILRTKHS